MDDDDPLPQMHAFDRLSIPAVLVLDIDGAARVASAAGIHDPVVVPVAFGTDPNVMPGDCFTPNLTAIFEPDDVEEPDEPWDGPWDGSADTQMQDNGSGEPAPNED